MGDGPGVAIPGLRFLVAYHSGHPVDQRMGHAQPNRERRHSRRTLARPIRSSGACLGFAQATPRSGARAWQGVPDGSLIAPRARPHQDIWICECRRLSLKDLSASIWLWHRQDGAWQIEKVIEIPAEPADPEKLPPLLKGFKAVPPFVTDIDLSLD